jgi:hypothetical protein
VTSLASGVSIPDVFVAWTSSADGDSAACGASRFALRRRGGVAGLAVAAFFAAPARLRGFIDLLAFLAGLDAFALAAASALRAFLTAFLASLASIFASRAVRFRSCQRASAAFSSFRSPATLVGIAPRVLELVMISKHPAAHLNETCHQEVAIRLKRIPPPLGCKKIVTLAFHSVNSGRPESGGNRESVRSAGLDSGCGPAPRRPPQDEALDRSIALTPRTIEAMHRSAQIAISYGVLNLVYLGRDRARFRGLGAPHEDSSIPFLPRPLPCICAAYVRKSQHETSSALPPEIWFDH